jgi:hypothetical protein
MSHLKSELKTQTVHGGLKKDTQPIYIGLIEIIRLNQAKL